MKYVSSEVRKDYDEYEKLLLGSKLTQGGPIFVSSQKASNVRWKSYHVAVEHVGKPEEPSELHAEVSCYDDGKFKFLLFAKKFMPTPLVNFDSDGGAHRNNFDDVPFPYQQIGTPHFNRYNETGHRYAYQPHALTASEDVQQFKKPNPSIILFYDEFSLTHSPAGYPQVFFRAVTQNELFPNLTFNDPLAHVTRF